MASPTQNLTIFVRPRSSDAEEWTSYGEYQVTGEMTIDNAREAIEEEGAPQEGEKWIVVGKDDDGNLSVLTFEVLAPVKAQVVVR